MQHFVKVIALVAISMLAFSVVVWADDVNDESADRQASPFLKNAASTNFADDRITASQQADIPHPVSLGPVKTNAVGVQIGTTSFDYQHNGTMGRQIEHRNSGYVHFDWTDRYAMGSRGVGYQVYDLTACEFLYTPDPIRVNVYDAGYVTLDVDPGGCGIPGAHELLSTVNISQAYWDECTGGDPTETFSSDGPTDRFGGWLNNFTGPDNTNIWPVVEWQPGTTEDVLHMVCAERGSDFEEPLTISYYRRVGSYASGVWSPQRVIDTVMTITPVVVASPTSDKVAIVWNAPADYARDTDGEFSPEHMTMQRQNDVWFAISTNQGADWISGIGSGSIGNAVDLGVGAGYNVNVGGNITTYAPESDYKAYANVTALFTAADDNLHIVWNCQRFDGLTSVYRRQCAMFHWSQDHPTISTVVEALWDDGTPGANPHTWGMDADKPGLCECDGKLYVVYTQFGNEALPSYDRSYYGYMNGEIYVTGSRDGGVKWSLFPQNLTNSESFDCFKDCENDYWPTVARYGRVGCCGQYDGQQVIDILYINDLEAGSVTQDGTQSTENPVMWLVTPCFDIVDDTCQLQYPGDIDNNGSLGGGDFNYLIDFLYSGGPEPPVMANADPNGDCWVDRADLEYLIEYLSSVGPPPVECTCVDPVVCNCLLGDANGDGTINIGDEVYIENIVFRPGSPDPVPYAVCNGDANFDCKVNIGDAVFIGNIVFRPGSPFPPDCHTWVSDPVGGCGWPLHKKK